MKYWDSGLNAPMSRTFSTVHLAAAVIGWRRSRQERTGVMKNLGMETEVDETSHQHRKQDDKFLTVDGDGKPCVRCVVSVFVLVCSFAGYGLVSVYDQRRLNFFWCPLWTCCVWSKVAMRIFCLDINEDGMVVELKQQGCQARFV